MKATGTRSKFNLTEFVVEEDIEKMMDSKMIGHTSQFKSVTRGKLDRIKGDRPTYEKEFSNSVGRYNVKHIDKKITGKVILDTSETRPRQAHPGKLCRRGLTKLAEIALDVRKSS